MHNSSLGKPPPIEMLCSHNDARTRKAGLQYLAEKGNLKDLPLVNKLRTDSDSDVRNQAETTRNAITIRADASHFFATTVLPSPLVSDDCLQSVRSHVANIRIELLKEALSHPNRNVQVFAAKELAIRGLILEHEIKGLKDSVLVCEALREYYRHQIKLGHKFLAHEIREGLTAGRIDLLFSGTAKEDIEPVMAELFTLYTYEELLPVADSEAEDAVITYRVLAEKHFGKFGERVRSDLRSQFAALRAKVEKKEQLHSGLGAAFYSLSWLIAKGGQDTTDFEVVAVNAIALAGQKSDRELIITFLNHKSPRVQIATIRALARVGIVEDAKMLLMIVERSINEIATEAAKAALLLSPGEAGSALVLLKSRRPAIVKLALTSLLNGDQNRVWAHLKERLYDENEEVRGLICAYAIMKFSPQRLAKLLDAYLEKESYFYNVVFYLDRALYARPPLRKFFIKQIVAGLE